MINYGKLFDRLEYKALSYWINEINKANEDAVNMAYATLHKLINSGDLRRIDVNSTEIISEAFGIHPRELIDYQGSIEPNAWSEIERLTWKLDYWVEESRRLATEVINSLPNQDVSEEEITEIKSIVLDLDDVIKKIKQQLIEKNLKNLGADPNTEVISLNELSLKLNIKQESIMSSVKQDKQIDNYSYLGYFNGRHLFYERVDA